MIIFELYRQLDIRIYQTVSAVDPGYGSCAKYILDGDSLVLLGTDHSIRLNMPSKTMTPDVPMRNWDTDAETVLWFSEDSNEAAIIRLICSAFGYYLNSQQFVTPEEFAGMVTACNDILSQYELKVLVDDTGMCVFHEDGGCSFEDAINLIMDIDQNRMDENALVNLINEALYYRKLDRMEDAAQQLEKVVRYADHSEQIYTDAVFLLAETYYFAGNYERAVQLYYRCNMDFIDEETDFFLHLGHALLDERMKKYERQIRIYYRSKLDAEYADTHRQAVAAAVIEIGEVFDEYEETCLEMGRKKYNEYINNLPVGADDIDEILFFEKPEVEDEEPEIVKNYKDIKLRENPTVTGDKSLNTQELLSGALSLYMDGDYQEAFDSYSKVKEEVPAESDYATWAYYMIGKMYCFFGEPSKAETALKKCNPNKFGKVYRRDDFLILYTHVKIVNEGFDSDQRFAVLLRGRLDNYFAQYDREYNSLLKDRKLMKAYREYEVECLNTSKKDFETVIEEDKRPVEKKSGVFRTIKKIITGKV